MHIGVFLIQMPLFIHLICHCASLSTTFVLSQSMTWHGLWWLTCELHYSVLLWRLGSVYQLWKSPLLSCVPWSSDRSSCLSHASVSSDLKALYKSVIIIIIIIISNIWAGAVLAKDTVDQFGLLIFDLVLRVNHKVPSSCEQSTWRDLGVRRTPKLCQ